MASKKKPSAKQLRARELFARRVKRGDFKKKKSGSRKSAGSKRTKSAKVKRKSNTRKPMARRKFVRRARKTASRVGKTRGKIGSFFKKGMVGDTTSALGASIVTGAVTDRVIPQYSIYAQAGAEYLVGGVGGLIGAEVVKSVVGLPSILNGLNIFGGTQQVEAGV